MSNLGTDFSCVDDLDAMLSVVSGRTGLAQAVCRRLITQGGSLWYDASYGYDVRGLINRGFRAGTIAGPINFEAAKDERVAALTSRVVQRDSQGYIIGESPLASPNVEQLDIQMQLTDGDGPFTMTLSVSAVDAKMLMGT